MYTFLQDLSALYNLRFDTVIRCRFVSRFFVVRPHSPYVICFIRAVRASVPSGRVILIVAVVFVFIFFFRESASAVSAVFSCICIFLQEWSVAE